MRRLAVALALLSTVACRSAEAYGTGTGPLPRIGSFAATPATIARGDQSVLTWTVSDATSLTIDGGVGNVTGRTSVTVTPSATTTYRLTATNADGWSDWTATVTVTSGGSSSGGTSGGSTSSGGTSSGSTSSGGTSSGSTSSGGGTSGGSTSSGGTSGGSTSSGGTSSGGTQAPVISSFTASPASITSGGSSTLAWTVSNASSLSIGGLGDVTGRSSASVSPSATTTYVLTASGAGGTRTASVIVTVGSSPPADVTLTIDTSQGRRAISPYVYGYNAATVAEAAPGATYLRIGGNRWTAYNWTSNYSNAGADWGPYANDTHMGSPADGPGHALTPTIDDAKTKGVTALVTIPIQGWVAKDQSGNVPLSSALTDHFVPSKPRKGSAFTTAPSATSAEVYQDELASFVAQRFGAGHELHLSLDNEPDLWGWVGADGKGNATHPEVQRTQLGYADFLARWLESAGAIKDAVPGALLYGPVSYGWQGYVSFQNAPDAPATASIDSSFLDHFLARVSAASSSQGRRLLDVLDVHFYSSATSTGCANSADDGVLVQAGDYDTGAPAWVKRNHDCVVAARVQAPRSLHDAAYVESSWITQWSTKSSAFGQAIQLVPRLLAKIAAGYPGTRLSLTEYNHGGADHISGALAEADALGIFGREGVYAAAYWPITTDTTWIKAAFRTFRNYDGAGKSFGDTSVRATSTDADHVGVYASVDASSAGRVVLVIVHRPTLSSGTLDLRSRTVNLQVTHPQALGKARAWQLTSASTTPAALPAPTVSGNGVTLTLPAMSVTTLELTP